MRWYDGYDFLDDSKSDYSQLPLLKVSMYLTSIFRSEIFTSGAIKQYFENGVSDKLMSRLACLMHMGSSSMQQYWSDVEKNLGNQNEMQQKKKGMILTSAKTQSGSEIFPDGNNIFQNISELKDYLIEILLVK